MKAAPEAHDFMFFRHRPGEPERRLDRLRTAAVKMGAPQPGRRRLGQQLESLGALGRGESPHGQTTRLTRQRLRHHRMGMAEARDRHAGKEIQIDVAVGVGQSRARAVIKSESGQQRDPLTARRDIALLALENRAGLGSGDRQRNVRHPRRVGVV